VKIGEDSDSKWSRRPWKTDAFFRDAQACRFEPERLHAKNQRHAKEHSDAGKPEPSSRSHLDDPA
jgi:hypothetical protein